MSELKILEPIAKKYKITLETGLHIWAWDWGLKIGWIDSQVVKNPLSWEPYIPGSSIKWKMRAMLEMIKWDYKEKNNWEFWPSEDIKNSSNIAKAFWIATKDLKISSRIIFSDFELTQKYKKEFKEKWPDFFEDKSENNVPRFLSWDAGPRHIERVPAWVEFQGKITLMPVDWENGISKGELEKILEEWIKYLQMAWLWGWVSRWNWQVKIED